MCGNKKRGFTLVEIMVATAIIGLLAALAYPYLGRGRIKARQVKIAKDYQAAAQAFIGYCMDHGGYPPDRTPAQMPPGMADYLGRFPWRDETAIGGRWDWDYLQFGFTAGVSIYQPDWGAGEMAGIDQLLDDGNLATGEFQARSDGYIYIIEQ
jgi:prepilin-type N-terminal cleavage/methylation domain-containing protein